MKKRLFSRFEIAFVLFIPIINVIADLTTQLFSSTSVNSGNIRALAFIVFIIAFSKKFLLNTRENRFLLIFLMYLFTLSFLSSDIPYTLYVYIKLFITTMMFPIGYYYISSPNIYSKFNKALYWSLAIVVLGTLASMALGLGKVAYGDESTTFGAFGPNISKVITVLVLILVHAFIIKSIKIKSKYIFFSFILIGIFLVFLTVKRTSMAAIVLGFMTYLYFIPKSGRIFRMVLVSITILLLLSPLYLPKIEERFGYREDVMAVEHFEEDDIKEWRIIETEIALKAFQEKNIAYKLFGFELFNGRSYFDLRYMFHNDFATLIAGTGLLGVFLYLLFYFSIVSKVLARPKRNKIINFHKAIIYTLLVIVIFFSISGHLKNIGVRVFIMLYLGASLAQINYHKRI